jgi:hypothetical protein
MKRCVERPAVTCSVWGNQEFEDPHTHTHTHVSFTDFSVVISCMGVSGASVMNVSRHANKDKKQAGRPLKDFGACQGDRGNFEADYW